jgi:hypothetical protein
MKIIEILNGLQVPITNEEADILKKFNEAEIIDRAELDEREREVANSLVNKEILNRRAKDGKVNYSKKIRD